MNENFSHYVKKLFDVMKFKFEAMYGYDIVSAIEISAPDYAGKRKT